MNPSLTEPNVDDKIAAQVDVVALPDRSHALSAGDALELLQTHEHIDLDQVDPAKIRRVVRKIDMVMSVFSVIWASAITLT